MLFSNIFEYFQPSLFQRCTTKIHSFSPPKSFRCTSGFRVLAARPPRGCVGRSATGVTPSRRPWCNRVEGFWVSACFWGERNNIRLNMVKLHYITLHYIIYIIYFTLHYITLHTLHTQLDGSVSSYIQPAVMATPVLGSAIYHSSAWQVSYMKYFMGVY